MAAGVASSQNMPSLSTPVVNIPQTLTPETRPFQLKRSRRSLTIRSKAKTKEEAFKQTKQVRVDYDKGIHDVSLNLTGFKKEDIPRRYRIGVESDKFQKDWDISEVVNKILKLNHWEDVDGLLNRWAGRFARKNFPVLIRVLYLFFGFFIFFAYRIDFNVADLLIYL